MGAPMGVTFREALSVWARVALQSFGGPAGQIAVMHRILVEERRWFTEARFLHALNYCMLLPGPEAQQLTIYAGWLLHGYRGGIVAGTLFVLPGFVSILALSVAYVLFGDVLVVEALFFGLTAAVIALVAQAVLRIGSRVLRRPLSIALAVGAFVAIFFLTIPFPLVIVTAAVVGLSAGVARPHWLAAAPAHTDDASHEGVLPLTSRHTDASAGRALRVTLVAGGAWLLPVVALLVLAGPGSVWFEQARFFSQAAVVTFGGAYSVLAYVAQEAVEVHGWLEPGEMLRGLGMAETTPGPLIQVVQFVGFMGAYRDPGALHPLLAATLAAVLVTWVTFAPCFLWIFLGAPYVERLRGVRVLDTALAAITAAVVGVIANLAVWFAMHVLFAEVEERREAGIRLLVPDPATLDVVALALGVAAFIAIFGFKAGSIRVLAGAAVASVAIRLVQSAV